MKKKNNKQRKNQNIILSDNEILSLSEKIVDRAFKIDKFGEKLIKWIIILFFFLLYVNLFLINSPKSEIDKYIYENIIPLISEIILVLAMILMVSVAIILFFSMFYKQKKGKSYDKKRVIQLLLLELTNNPDKKRKSEILKLLTFNLTKLLDDFRIGLINFSQYDWKRFFRMNQMGLRFKFQTISKMSSFIEQAIIFLDIKQYKDTFVKIGALLINDDYHELNQLLIQNDTLFKEIEIIKKQTNLSSEKHRIQKVKNLIVFTSNNYKFVLLLLAVLLFIYLLLTGKLSSLPSSLFGF
jgi:hypothetical protein